MSVFKIKTGSEETYSKFNTPSVNRILVDHLIQYDDLVKIGEPVFFLFGGDGTPWENGLAGICKIASKPLELGYETAKNGKYYKLELEIVYRLKTHMTKMDFSKYPETFDTGIGPSTKGERNQALGVIENKKAVASLCRAVMDKDPEISNCILSTFGNEIFNFAKQNTIVYVSPSDDSKTNTSNVSQHNFSQIIYYGVPGSGKSNEINNILKKEITNDKDREFQVCRVVFHPEYTNADFVGQVLPRVKGGSIKYEFKPGPFAKILYRALHNPEKKFFLIIEEINRGNAAAIFGDIFQLLDRIESINDSEKIGSNTFGIGWSKYFIENDYINNYIRSKVEYSDEAYTEEHGNKEISLGDNIIFSANTSLRLPPNLSLLATMNTSDQNVFTLDNAFQRRWDMQLVKNECSDTNQMKATITVNNQKITWEDFQQTINSVIGEKSNEGGLSSMEDKRLGCWFVKAEDKEIKPEVFANKVLKYLWDDAFKFYHQEIFAGDIKNFEELHQRFLAYGFSVFNDVCRLGEKLQPADNSTDSDTISE